MLDYSKLGLKCGIEIHQQLDTHKLFCGCPSTIRDEPPDFTIKRKLRAVAGELGNVDPAALYELLRDQEFIYEVYSDTNCLVESDSEPPGPLNRDALKIVLESAMLLNARPVDEVQVMRKTVIDGSNTSGFQRTALIAMDGSVDVDGKKIGVPTICLEEDAARIIKKEGNVTTYRLDRLGIPLIEIGTDPDITSPDEAKACAERIGMILRATGKVKRGLGTIRQDVNVSIRDGRRIEIKGVQALNDIPKLVENEVRRQLALVDIKRTLKSKKVAKKDLVAKSKDLTSLFRKTSSKLVKDKPVFGFKLKGFAGILGTELMPGYRFGTELAGIAKGFGLKGILHSDELPNYGITEEEVKSVAKALGATGNDGFVLVISEKEKAEEVIKAIVERCQTALEGVPKEVRRADGEITRFMRPLPGSARMYPETDELTVKVDASMLKDVKSGLSLMPEEEKKELKKLGLGDELVNQLIHSPDLKEFKALLGSFKSIKSSVIAQALLAKPNRVDIDGLRSVLRLVNDKKIAKESIAEVMEAMISGKPAVEIAKEKDLFLMGEDEVRAKIKAVLAANKELAGKKQMGPLMGRVMSELRGKADVSDIQRILKEELK